MGSPLLHRDLHWVTELRCPWPHWTALVSAGILLVDRSNCFGNFEPSALAHTCAHTYTHFNFFPLPFIFFFGAADLFANMRIVS